MNLSPKERAILELLDISGEMYGLELVQADRELKRGTVYVTLGRMADKGLVNSRVEKTAGNQGPARRLYRATGLGQRALIADRYSAAILAGVHAT